MFSELRSLFSFLYIWKPRRVIRLLILVTFLAFVETTMVVSVGLFASLLGEVDTLEQNLGLFSFVANYLNNSELVWFVVVGFASIWSASSILSILGLRYINVTGFSLGLGLSTLLTRAYISKPFEYHLTHEPSLLISRVQAEINRVSAGVLLPSFHLFSKLVLLVAILIALLIYDFSVTMIVGGGVVCLYVLIYLLTRNRLKKNGLLMTEANSQRQLTLSSAFNSLRSIIIFGRYNYFNESFEKETHKLIESQSSNATIGAVPKYGIEWFVFMGLAVFSLISTSYENISSANVYGTLAVFAVAALKLLPAFQQIFNYIATIKGNVSAWKCIHDDVSSSLNYNQADIPLVSTSLIGFVSIELDSVSYRYPSSSEYAFARQSFSLKGGKSYAVVGASGSGKSTFIDLLCGLLRPSEGIISFICEQNNNVSPVISYVPQDVTLVKGSLAGNVAFGIDENKIDLERVKVCLSVAMLDDLVSSLSDGIFHELNENGAALSGGQRQRLGVARAMYVNADLYILDEATSALDSETEKALIERLMLFCRGKTVFMVTHHHNILSYFDDVLRFENSVLVSNNSY